MNLPKSKYETYNSDAVYNSGNSKPGYAPYEENTIYRLLFTSWLSDMKVK